MSPVRFALLGHPYSVEHLNRIFRYHYPDMHGVSPEFVKKIFEWTEPYADVFVPFRSASGACAEGYYLMAPLFPNSPPKHILRQTLQTLALADKMDLGLSALGGYTSLVGERYPEQLPMQPGRAATTGNVYTAALTVEGIRKVAETMSRDIAGLNLLIVGFSDVGVGVARALAKDCARVAIASRNLSKWQSLVDDLRATPARNQIEFVTDMRSVVSEFDFTIISVNVFDRSFDFDQFKSGAVICDAGYPKNVAQFFQTHPTVRPDIFVYNGGYAKMPDVIDFGYDLGLPKTNITYGCFGEAIILALEGRCESLSTGRGKIQVDAMNEIMGLGRTHGFEVEPFFVGNQRVPEKAIRQFAEQWPLNT